MVGAEEVPKGRAPRPCPFCLGEDCTMQLDHQKGYYVRCVGCRAEGPPDGVKLVALMLWGVRL